MRRGLRGAVLATATAIVGWVLYQTLRSFDVSLLARVGVVELAVLLGLRFADISVNLASVRALLAGLGYGVRPWPLFLVLNASSAGNATTPFKLGLPLRVYLYHRELKVPAPAASLAVVLESYASILVTGAFAIYSVGLFFPHRVGQWGALLAALAASAIGGAWVWHRLRRRRRPLLGREPTAAECSPSLRSRALALFLFVALLAVDVVLSGLLLQVSLGALGSKVDLLALVSFQSLSFVVGVVSLLPMGLGAKEASLVFLLGRVGVPSPTALAAAALVRVLTTGVTLVVGAFSLQALGLKRRPSP